MIVKYEQWKSTMYSKTMNPRLVQYYNIIDSDDTFFLDMFYRQKKSIMKSSCVLSKSENVLSLQNITTGEIYFTEKNNPFLVQGLYGITWLAIDYFLEIFNAKKKLYVHSEDEFSRSIDDIHFFIFENKSNLKIKYFVKGRMYILERVMKIF